MATRPVADQPTVQLHLLKVGSCRHLERVAMRGGRFTLITFPALAALIIHPVCGPILFDTGYADHFHDATRPFPERLYRWATPVALPAHQTLARQLARFGLTPSDVRLCILSHCHGDHIAGLRDLPGATILAMRSAYDNLKNCGRIRGLMHGLLPALLPPGIDSRIRFAESHASRVLPAPWSSLGRGFDLIGDGSLLAVPLPGHAAGHMGLIARDVAGRQVLLAADSSWSMCAIREYRLPSAIVRPLMHHWGEYESTLRELHQLSVRHAEIVILPSHCESSLAAYQAGWTSQ